MSFASHFRSSNKRDLSCEKSEAGDGTKKKMRKNSSTASVSVNDDIFLEGLKSDICRSILANYFENI